MHREWTSIWRRLPWVTGIGLALVLVIPWYALAEYRTQVFYAISLLGSILNAFWCRTGLGTCMELVVRGHEERSGCSGLLRACHGQWPYFLFSSDVGAMRYSKRRPEKKCSIIGG